MTPDYERDGVRLYCCDCRDLLAELPDGAIITDPPYGIGYQNKRNDLTGKTYDPTICGDMDWDSIQCVIANARKLGHPVCAFAHHRRPWPGDWRQWLVWDKGGAVGGGGDRETCWKFTWELIQVGGFGELNGIRDEAVLRYPLFQFDLSDHPTQKPLTLMEYLVNKLTHRGSLVIDPFMGSASTAVACIRTGRRFIGCEIDRRYFDIAVRRVEEAFADQGLFRQAETAEPDPELFP